MLRSDYDRVNDYNQWKEIILGFSTLATMIITGDEKWKIFTSPELRSIPIILITFNVVFVTLYVYWGLRADYIFSKAEKNRRLQYLDDSFETNFAGKRTEGYFSQDKLSPGFYKLAINCFENVFHTFSILKKMQSRVYLKAITVSIIFILSSAYGDKGVIRAIFEAILPLASIQEAIKLAIFVSRLEIVKENFSTFFSSIRNTSFTDREPEALKNVIDYETILAWAATPLDSKIFMEMRQQLATEWEDLKIQYNIK